MKILICFFNDTATTEIYTLSLHDALPISPWSTARSSSGLVGVGSKPHDARQRIYRDHASAGGDAQHLQGVRRRSCRSEEHTSELQSRQYLVCRLLLEKKKYIINPRRDCVESSLAKHEDINLFF